MKRSPLGIFGGTFDPPHYGHLRLAEEARAMLGLLEVLWVPAGRPALRDAPRTAPLQRLEMVRHAIAGNPAFLLDDAEAHSPQPSYTVPTLERLRQRHGDRPLVLLLGADAFARLEGWHRWRDLFALAHIGVATRPGSSLDPAALSPELAAACQVRLTDDPADLAHEPAGRICPFAMTALDISATRIRALLARRISPRYLLPDAVLDHIYSHHLFTWETHGHSQDATHRG